VTCLQEQKLGEQKAMSKNLLGGVVNLSWSRYMSATELLKQVAALPQRERTLFEELFEAMKSGSHEPAPANKASGPDFGDRLPGIYGNKITSDSQKIIREGRGDR